MAFLFALIAINILSVPLVLLMCGKKENENENQTATLKCEKSQQEEEENTVELNFSEVCIEMSDEPVKSRRADVYHEAAESLAWPASRRCKNHDDVWRILALYLDYIRAVNPEEFSQHRLLDSALAVLHDLGRFIRTDHLSNDAIALAVVYFLVDFHKIKVKLGNEETPWFAALCRTAKIEDLERMRITIENELIRTRSDEMTVVGSGVPPPHVPLADKSDERTLADIESIQSEKVVIKEKKLKLSASPAASTPKIKTPTATQQLIPPRSPAKTLQATSPMNS